MPPQRSTPPPAALSRRAAPELTWQNRAEDRSSERELAALARSISSSPTSTQTIANARAAAAPAPVSVPQAAALEAGRLVDEVMSRLDRRMRSERQRRGL